VTTSPPATNRMSLPNANLNGDSLVNSITRYARQLDATPSADRTYQLDLRYTRDVLTLKERFRAHFCTEATNVFKSPKCHKPENGGSLVDNSGGFASKTCQLAYLGSNALWTKSRFPSGFGTPSATSLQGRILNISD